MPRSGRTECRRPLAASYLHAIQKTAPCNIPDEQKRGTGHCTTAFFSVTESVVASGWLKGEVLQSSVIDTLSTSKLERSQSPAWSFPTHIKKRRWRGGGRSGYLSSSENNSLACAEESQTSCTCHLCARKPEKGLQQQNASVSPQLPIPE